MGGVSVLNLNFDHRFLKKKSQQLQFCVLGFVQMCCGLII